MDHSVILIVCALACSHSAMLVLGLGFGIFLTKIYSQHNFEAPVGFLRSQGNQNKHNNKIEIDDKKVVLNINTEGLEKKFDKITEETKTKNNISGSVNKLKSMKGK